LNRSIALPGGSRYIPGSAENGEALHTDDGPPDDRPLTARDFHDARARDAEQDRLSYTALWHLDRLIAAETSKGEKAWLFARRGRVYAGSGQFEQAEADFRQAAAYTTRDELLCWYRHCSVDCQREGKWQPALWYLDRVVAAASGDWRLHADRAAVHAKLGQAVEHGADSETLLRITNEHAGRGLWDKATKALAKARERGGLPLAAAYWECLLALHAKDHDKHRRNCQRILVRLGDEPPAALANAVAWLCALAPGADADFARPLKLAELAVRSAAANERPNVLNTLGAVLYRAGRFQEAIGRLEEGIRTRKGEGMGQDWVFLAMAHHRLGEKEKARAYLAKLGNEPADVRGWDQLEMAVLRREAVTLLDGGRKKK
jgi:tetratricopeptide (TPR) repeat protein